MPLDQRQIKRTIDDAQRHLDTMRRNLRDLSNGFERLGIDFRNDRRFTSDSMKIRDRVREIERSLERLKDVVRQVERTNR